MDKKIYIYSDSNIISLIAVKPFYVFKSFCNIEFIKKEIKLYNPKIRGSIIVVRVFDHLSEDEIKIKVKKLKELYTKVIYFDDRDSPSINKSIISEVDLYWKKQIYKNKNIYLTQNPTIPIHKIYYKEANIDYSNKLNQDDLAKLRLAWNLGVGNYPINYISLRILWRLSKYFNIAKLYNKNKLTFTNKSKINVVNVMFRNRKGHRNIILNNLPKKFRYYHESKFNYIYNRRLKRSLITISPFGHGEICFRDFEAVVSNSLMFKPSMNHIITYPNIYKLDTYVEFNWDLSDLEDKLSYFLENPEKVKQIVGLAKNNYLIEISKLQIIFDNLIQEL